MTMAEALTEASERLGSAGVADSRRTASLLLCHVLRRPGTFLIAHPEYELTSTEIADLDRVVARRELREPLQYITGVQEFFGLEFEVGPDVLIPRPETELLVETAIEFLRETPSPRFLEIGVGSGCISVSILKNLSAAGSVATDVSAAALRIAQRNAALHGVDDRLSLMETDLTSGIEDRFDLIVSNPPYVPETDIDGLEPEVALYEPKEALFAGPDGLLVIKRMIDAAPDNLVDDGVLMLEIGFGQGDAVKDYLGNRPWISVRLLPDLQGIPRVVIARRS